MKDRTRLTLPDANLAAIFNSPAVAAAVCFSLGKGLVSSKQSSPHDSKLTVAGCDLSRVLYSNEYSSESAGQVRRSVGGVKCSCRSKIRATCVIMCRKKRT